LTWLIVIGVVITTALPILAAINLSRQQADESARDYAVEIARRALDRSEMTGEQLGQAAKSLAVLNPAEACGPKGLDLMRRIDLRSTMLQAVGWAEGDTMRCSSFSGDRPFALGPADFVSEHGSKFRVDVTLLDDDLSYLVVQTGPALGIIHRDLPLSFVDDIPGLKVGLFSWSDRVPMATRGDVPAELFATRFAGDVVFRHGGHLVAVVKSKRYDIGTIAMVPIGYGANYAGQTAILLIPLGIVVGLILSTLLVYVVRTRLSMPAMIRTALARRQFFLLYQPVVELSSGRIIGAEALIRWDRGAAGEIPTDRFIDAAEEAGLVPLITAHVLELLADDARQVLTLMADFRFSVNLSASDLYRPSILGEVDRLLDRSGMRADNLVIEATERSLVDVDRARETIGRLRAMGVRLAIDDFGTGYSSLAYLAQIEADLLKIDKLFVQALGTESATSQVAARIIEMGKDLSLRIVAEGIESKRQERLLKRLGVECGQGYLYGQPMAVGDLLLRLYYDGKSDRAKAKPRLLKVAA
jgi:sensor c-di-GMP phosphodiesterase-like protein